MKNNFFIDSRLYFLNDPSDKDFQFHHLYGLAFNRDDESSLIKDATEAFGKYGIYWFDPDRSEDAFFDESPVNSYDQDVVFRKLGDKLTDYIIDIFEVLLKHNVTIHRSIDHKSYMEGNSMNMDMITRFYNENVRTLTFSFLKANADENGYHDHLRLIYQDKYVKKTLDDIEATHLCVEANEREVVFVAILDFFHSFINYYFHLLYKGKKNKNYPIIEEIKNKYYPLIIHNPYSIEKREISKEIVAALLGLKNRQ